MNRHQLKKKNKGQGMTEYMIIVALIAVGTIAMVRTVGMNVQAGFGTIANALVGQQQKVDGKTVEKGGAVRRDMGDFNQDVENQGNSGLGNGMPF